MLDLVSSLSYLKLTSAAVNGKDSKPQATNEIEANGRSGNADDVMLKQRNQTSVNNKQQLTNGTSCHAHNNSATLMNSYQSNIMSLRTQNQQSSLIAKASCKPYIFEKVDYIKKISIRRKATKKLRKVARNKSHQASTISTATNPVNESPKIKM